MSESKIRSQSEIFTALEEVRDPEIPVLSVIDMGIISKVEVNEEGATIWMTPTFVGCPAIDLMKREIRDCIHKLGIEKVEVKLDFEKAWTSDMMSEAGREKLEKFGLAPPVLIHGDLDMESLNQVRCPHCGNRDTTLRSSFGSTLCRAIRYCPSCKQTFEQFKPV